MESLNIAIVGGSNETRKNAAAALGKKGTQLDITGYHTNFQGKLVNIIEPTAYPDKPTALAFALNVADFVVLLAETNAHLGETLVLCSMLAKAHGAVVGNTDMEAYLREANLNYATYPSMDIAKPAILSHETAHKVDGPLKAWVDQSFDVKGVGAVALGFIASGSFKIHDQISVWPKDKKIEIRSIQKNDADVDHAFAGDRFGIRFKNLEASELSRGTVLGHANVFHEIEASVTVPKYLKNPPGRQLHAVAGLQSTPCKTDKDLALGKTTECLLEFEKQMCLHKDTLTLLDLNTKGLRVAGVAENLG
jgi:selenocysteine-specific translation elongation factor